jgi:3-methylcrotonyl-CoA carboxylase beta subunit
MSIIESRISNRADEFKHNSSAMRELVDDLRAKAATIAEGGGPA